MSKSFRKDLTGQRFGRLTVIEFVPNDKKNGYWKCNCDCGKKTIVRDADLNNGHTLSCGCLVKEAVAASHTTHNLSNTRIFNIWRGMRARCYNPNRKQYNDYGGRGITVCDEWRDNFQAFYDWAMSNGYDDNLTIDRIDNDKGYSPDNCKWQRKKIKPATGEAMLLLNIKGIK